MLCRFLRIYLPLLIGCILFTVIAHDGLSNQAASQKPAASLPQLPPRISDQTYRVSVDLVNVLCSAFDRNTNSFVTNLTRDDFIIYEDGQKQEIKNFARETNLPLTLAMLIDTSDSVAPKLRFEQEAAISFFQSILREKDRAMLVEFDSGVTLLQDFTGDPNKLAREIRKLKAAGGTALYDAIYITCDEKLIRETGRKAIVILSDGDDESSDTTYEEALEMALRAESTVFAISISKGGFFGVEGSKEGDTVLKDMARETGGKVFFPFKLDELDDNFRQINQELRSQYSLGYYSTNTVRDGSYRKLEIKASEKSLKLNHRKGYYAPVN
ncbi:MAG: VWA domain-containing protein [Acidobacteria bacterium]|nr:VWA domain-containing protein [Acidobacteriota bacterium]